MGVYSNKNFSFYADSLISTLSAFNLSILSFKVFLNLSIFFAVLLSASLRATLRDPS